MVLPLTVINLFLCAALGCVAGYYLLRKRLIDDPLLAVAGLLELGLIGQLIVGLTRLGRVTSSADGVTFVAYLFTVLVVPPFVAVMAIKEKSQWAMGVMIVGAFVSAVLVGRLEQIWAAASA